MLQKKSKNKKILVASFHSRFTSGGIQTFDRNIELFFEKYDVDFLSVYKSKDNYSLKFPNGKVSKVINYIFSYRITALLLYFFLKKNNKYDFIIINSPSFIRYINCKKNKVILIQHHDIDTMIKNRSNFNNSKFLISKAVKDLYSFVFLSSNAIVTDKYFQGMIDRRIIIEHVTHIEKIQIKKIKEKKLIMICRIENKQKRLDLVIDAMDYLPEWTLNIYGDGPDFKFIQALAQKAKNRNVFLHGNTNDVTSALDLNSIHVMSSDYEGFGISNIEAMRRGLPLIIRNTFSAAQDIINNNGILLKKKWDYKEFISAINVIYNDYEIYSENSIKESERFSFDLNKKKWLKLIEG